MTWPHRLPRSSIFNLFQFYFSSSTRRSEDQVTSSPSVSLHLRRLVPALGEADAFQSELRRQQQNGQVVDDGKHPRSLQSVRTPTNPAASMARSLDPVTQSVSKIFGPKMLKKKSGSAKQVGSNREILWATTPSKFALRNTTTQPGPIGCLPIKIQTHVETGRRRSKQPPGSGQVDSAVLQGSARQPPSSEASTREDLKIAIQSSSRTESSVCGSLAEPICSHPFVRDFEAQLVRFGGPHRPPSFDVSTRPQDGCEHHLDLQDLLDVRFHLFCAPMARTWLLGEPSERSLIYRYIHICIYVYILHIYIYVYILYILYIFLLIYLGTVIQGTFYSTKRWLST